MKKFRFFFVDFQKQRNKPSQKKESASVAVTDWKDCLQ